jgi:hypothetical protein
MKAALAAVFAAGYVAAQHPREQPDIRRVVTKLDAGDEFRSRVAMNYDPGSESELQAEFARDARGLLVRFAKLVRELLRRRCDRDRSRLLDELAVFG